MRMESMEMRGVLGAIRARLAPMWGDEAPSLAEYAVAGVLGIRRLDVHLQSSRRLESGQADALERVVQRLEALEPLQYVLGWADFMGRRFVADRRALIPRPETEMVVRAAGAWAASCPTGRPIPRLADVGTGSGIIAVTLALDVPRLCLYASDRSAAALDLARENARVHGVEDRITWRRGDLLAPYAAGELDAVASNLPYIPRAECAVLDPHIIRHEPREALDGGPDGLALVRRLMEEAAEKLARPGRLFLEIGDGQGPAAEAAFREAGYTAVEVERDLAGHDRLAAGRLD